MIRGILLLIPRTEYHCRHHISIKKDMRHKTPRTPRTCSCTVLPARLEPSARENTVRPPLNTTHLYIPQNHYVVCARACFRHVSGENMLTTTSFTVPPPQICAHVWVSKTNNSREVVKTRQRKTIHTRHILFLFSCTQ